LQQEQFIIYYNKGKILLLYNGIKPHFRPLSRVMMLILGCIVFYDNTAKLISILKIAKVDGSIMREIETETYICIIISKTDLVRKIKCRSFVPG